MLEHDAAVGPGRANRLAIDQDGAALDGQEAVYLADRVAVMSARPGRIKAIVDTRFDKQAPDVFKAKAFVDKVDELWNLVRIEAIKAQETGK